MRLRREVAVRKADLAAIVAALFVAASAFSVACGADSTYLLTVLLANGQVWRYEGRPDADRWMFELVSSRSGSTRLRQVLIPTGDTIEFLEEVSENGGPWRLSDPSEDFTYVRVRGGR
jgi:hypothetical protein